MNCLFIFKRLLFSLLLIAAGPVISQTCAAPGKDGPASPAGIVNTYYLGNGNLVASATNLTLGASSGAVGTVSIGDKLLVIQMQGADIDTMTMSVTATARA